MKAGLGEITKDENVVKVKVGENRFVADRSCKALLLFAILDKLEEIRCGLIDVETAIKNVKGGNKYEKGSR